MNKVGMQEPTHEPATIPPDGIQPARAAHPAAEMTEFRAALDRRRPATGVHVLSQPRLDAYYESALVFGLPAPLSRFVDRLRADLAIPSPDHHLLAPHLTVLFLGRHCARRIAQFSTALDSLRNSQESVVIESVGVFIRAGRIINVHLEASAADGVRRLQQRAIELLKLEGWSSPSPYILDRFRPHISIADRCDLDLACQARFQSLKLVRWQVDLSELTLMGKILDGKD